MRSTDTGAPARPVLQDVFRGVCAREAGREAVVVVEGGTTRRATYARLLRDAERVAGGFVRAGLEPGEHVAVWMPNGYEWIVTRFAVALAGLVLVPLNTRLRRDDLAQILKSSDARVLVTAERFANIDYLGILRAVGVLGDGGLVRNAAAAPKLERVISIAPEPAAGLEAFGDYLAARPDAAPRHEARPEDVLNIIFTSGTTSLPKGVIVLNGAATHNLLRINERWGQVPGDRFALSQPLFTSAGLGRSTAVLLAGATLVLQEGFDAREFLAVAHSERITATALTDTNVLDLMDITPADGRIPGGKPDIRVVLGLFSKGANSKHRFLRDTLGVRHVLSHYGLSETSHMTTLSSPEDTHAQVEDTVGRPLPEVRVDIVDPDTGEPKAPGTVGEIRIGGYVATPGYYNRPDATKEAFDAQGRLRTGDLGWIDEEGFVHFQSRLKDIIRVGGFNVTAGEIETLLRSQDEIREAAVVAIPDERLGEIPCAFVQFVSGRSISADELRNRLKGGVATYKLPRHLVEVKDWPRTGSEKIQKTALLESARESLAREGVRV